MRVDVIDLVGLDLGVAQRIAHHAIRAVAVFRWRSDVIRIAGTSRSRQFPPESARRGAWHARISSSTRIPAPSPTMKPSRDISHGRQACSRIVIALRQSAHRAESGHGQRRNAGLRAAADHHVGIVVLDHAERIADRMGAGSARRRGGRVRTFRAGADRNVARREVDDGRRNKKRRDARGAFFEQNLVLALDDFESADAAADIDAGALGLLCRAGG